MNGTDPHATAKVVAKGEPLSDAKSALILIHGRGSSASSILELAFAVGHPGFAYLAPEAVGNTWYPHSFMRPKEMNEPNLTSALACVGRVVDSVIEQGIPPERIAIAGFSQGACLAMEFAVQNPRRYGAVIGLSGGLIGPPGTEWPDSTEIKGTPVFIGCSDIDAHVPLERVQESAETFRQLGADVDERIYPDMDHTVNLDEATAVKALLKNMLG